jgi:sigma-E factor negative regulatory protein RseC
VIAIQLPEQTENPQIEMGVVIEVTDDLVRVQPHQHNACSSCGSSQICFPEQKPAPVVEANRTHDVNVGDIVELIHPDAPRLLAAFILFGFPVVTIMIGLVLGLNATGQEMQGGIAGALAGLAFGLLFARFINRFAKTNAALRPSIGPVLDPTTLHSTLEAE